VMLTSYPKGLVKICKNKKWGTLCGHYWWDNQKGAENICRHLGYGGGTHYTAPDISSLPILTGNRLCKGGEKSIWECEVQDGRKELERCIHEVDQGVHCTRGWVPGWCDNKQGKDQNRGATTLGTGYTKESCLEACMRTPYSQACEFSTENKGGCSVHTTPIGGGSGDANYFCYVLFDLGEECITENVAYKGNTIKTLKEVHSKINCACACKEHDGCLYFSWYEAHKECELKDSDKGVMPYKGAYSGERDCCKAKDLILEYHFPVEHGEELPVNKQASVKSICYGDCCYKEYAVVPFTGPAHGATSFPETQNTVEECAQKCEDLPDCGHFTFDTKHGSKKQCFLLKWSIDAVAEEKLYSKYEKRYAGLCYGRSFENKIWSNRQCGKPMDEFSKPIREQRFEKYDFKTAEECKKLCRETEGCNAVNYCKSPPRTNPKKKSVCHRLSCKSPFQEPDKTQSDCTGWVVTGTSWQHGKCTLTQTSPNDRSAKLYLGCFTEEETCLESCKTFALTGCETTKNICYDCNAFLKAIEPTPIVGREMQCYPFEKPNIECAHPKFGFTITNEGHIKYEKVRNTSECAELCNGENQCMHWSFEGCISGARGPFAERCQSDHTYNCKLYDKAYHDLTMEHTDNLHAAWGDRNTCKYVGCKGYQSQVITFEKHLKFKREGVETHEHCKQICNDLDSDQAPCVSFLFLKNESSCYLVQSHAYESLISLPLGHRDVKYGKDDCHNMCRKDLHDHPSRKCLQWDWRAVKVEGQQLFACMLLYKIKEVTHRPEREGPSFVGTKYSCINSQAQWSAGKCKGEDGEVINTRLQRREEKFTLDSCAILCSEDPSATACEYDASNHYCFVHTKTVVSSSSDPNHSCSIILPKATCKCGVVRTKPRTKRVVDGIDVEPAGKYPWVAMLEYMRPHRHGPACGGVLVATQWVITAAHCEDWRKQDVNHITAVVLGEHNWEIKGDDDDTSLFRTRYEVDFFMPHTYYNDTGNTEYDVALLKLVDEVPLSLHTPACLYKTNTDFTNHIAYAYGWGKKKLCEPDQHKVLQEVQMKILATSVCKKSKGKYKHLDDETDLCTEEDGDYSTMITDDMMCAKGVQDGSSVCRGDSGGPLTVPDRNGIHEVAGITSWGHDCGNNNFPAVFAKLNHPRIKSWVKGTMFHNGGSVTCETVN